MDITAVGGAVNYTPSKASQNINTTGSTQSASPTAQGAQSGVAQAPSGGDGASSGGASQTSSAGNSSSSTSSASAVYDPRDLNQDGIVTYAEEMQYALTHPLAAQQSQSSSAQSYNQQGQITNTAGATQSNINVYA